MIPISHLWLNTLLTLILYTVISCELCVYDCLLYKETSLMRCESCTHMGRKMNLGDSLILCLFSRIIAINSLLEPVSSVAMGS